MKAEESIEVIDVLDHDNICEQDINIEGSESDIGLMKASIDEEPPEEQQSLIDQKPENNETVDEGISEKGPEDFPSLFNGINQAHQELYSSITKARSYHGSLRDRISLFKEKIDVNEKNRLFLKSTVFDFYNTEGKKEFSDVKEEVKFTYDNGTKRSCREICEIASKIESDELSGFEEYSGLLDELQQKVSFLESSVSYIKILKELDSQRNTYESLKKEEGKMGLRFQTLAEVFNLDNKFS